MAALSAGLDHWSSFISHALATRLDTDTFESYVPLLNAKHPLPPPVVADVLLRPSPPNHDWLDPRILQYLPVLLKLKVVDTVAVLSALHRHSTSHSFSSSSNEGDSNTDTSKKVWRWTNSYGAEEVVFYRLTKAVAQGSAVKTTTEALQLAKAIGKWMTLFSSASASFAEAAVIGAISPPSQIKEEMESARAAFVMLCLGVFENQMVVDALSRPLAKSLREELSGCLSNFLPTIMQSSSEIAARLELFRTQTLASFDPVDNEKESEDAEMFDVYDQTVGLQNFQIAELPTENSRAGLFIYLNAALVGRPLLADTTLFTYLHNRYQGDLQSTAIALILASFDVLANAVFRNNEGAKSGLLLRSYLINKVPLLLASFPYALGTTYPEFDAEYCITQALNQVDTGVFPTLSSMFDASNDHNAFTETVRQDFCFSCLLHGLISKEARDDLLGEITFQELPVGGRYVKENLVQQCLADPERLQKLVGELEGMDGNAGAACQAVAEVMGQLCKNKETMALKQLCSQLARKPLSLDVLLLFNKAETLLQPLCELLDNWRYEEDQGEYQPVYEEFGAILLLLLAFAYRYDLSPADFKINSSDSFVARLLAKSQVGRPLEDLSEQEKGHIGGWVHGLFGSDAGGLGDELMSSCPPQDFYLLIPTLFQQIVLAFSSGILTEDMLKGGLEYLVDTFLLPSLVPAILYLSNHVWAYRPQDQKAIIRIFQMMLLPKSISNEASTMLSSVLNIVAEPLEHALRSYLRQEPKSQDVEPLLRALKDNIPLSRRTGNAYHHEVETWAGTSGGGLTASVRHTMQSLIQWSQNSNLGGMGTPYTHRQIMLTLRMIGAKRLLATIVDEVRQQTEAGSGAVAYDVATALICAPDVTNDPTPLQIPAATMPALDEAGNIPTLGQRRTTLRQALKSEAEEWKKLQKADPILAETVVRLYRRVEAQMVVPQVAAVSAAAAAAAMMQPNDLNLGVGDGSLGEAIAAAAAAGGGDGSGGEGGGGPNDGGGGGGLAGEDSLSLDTSVNLGLGGAGDLDLGSATNSAGGGLGLDEHDIFGDLASAGDFNLDSWSDINMV
ncbi:hypothetical protein VTK73DRAFT_3051 [Phialemonium thermophilum]|uniref:Mediator of RNA polymerase II transcription subunit 5 n=1 Tax=Phialemonium thermophilum TaxID=223376 RepID=A0ABR3X1S9_9PEZI